MPYAAHMPNIQDLSKDQRYITQDDGWKVFMFYAFGMKAGRNCRRCPETTKLLRRIPGMKTGFFSILAPGKHLRPHRGPYKGVLRMHLALIIPEPAGRCGITVAGETRHWQEGKVMIFDDVKQHEAWNHTDKTRVVLFVDIVRPLRFPANVVNACFMWMIAVSPFVLGAAGSYFRWERRFEDIVNKGAPAG
jgi:beta-hydroxylase